MSSLAFFLAACSNQSAEEAEGMNIVTSFYPIYSITEYISGDLNQVSMLQSDAGIHNFEPSANDIAAIEESDMFIYHSRTLESWAKDLDQTTSEDVQVVEASEGIELMKVPALENFEVPAGMDEKSVYDPHSWLDPISVAEEGQVIADVLSEADPENQEVYQENAQQLQQEAEDLVAEYQEKLSTKEHRTFITQHTAFQYLAERFDLEQFGIAGVSEEEPNPQRMAEILEIIEENNIQIIFMEENSSGKIAQTIADEAGIGVAILDPLEADPQNEKNILENIEVQLESLDQHLN